MALNSICQFFRKLNCIQSDWRAFINFLHDWLSFLHKWSNIFNNDLMQNFFRFSFFPHARLPIIWSFYLEINQLYDAINHNCVWILFFVLFAINLSPIFFLLAVETATWKKIPPTNIQLREWEIVINSNQCQKTIFNSNKLCNHCPPQLKCA